MRNFYYLNIYDRNKFTVISASIQDRLLKNESVCEDIDNIITKMDIYYRKLYVSLLYKTFREHL